MLGGKFEARGARGAVGEWRGGGQRGIRVLAVIIILCA